MRKLIIVTLLFTFLASCTLSKKETNFTALYNSFVKTSIQNIEKSTESLGYKRHESLEGIISAGLQIPILMSGSFKSNYDVKINNTDMSVLLENLKLNFESPINSGSVSAKRLGITSITGDLYLLMDEFIDVGLFPSEARAIFTKYNNKWLSYTQKDMDATLSGASAEDIMVSTVAKNISKMGMKDLESYLTSYPIWKSTGDLGMSGSLQRFSIDLDRESIIALVKKVTLDISGSGMTGEAEADLKNSLDVLSFSGVLAFDPKKSDIMDMTLDISQSGVLLGNIALSTSPVRTEMKFSSIQDKTNIIFTLTKSDDRSDVNLLLMQDDVEIGRLVGYVIREKWSLSEISLDATAQWITLGMKHTVKKDGNFEWRMTLPVGALSWNGKISGKKLDSLAIKWSMPMGSIDMNLIPDGDILRGPLVIKSGSDEMLRANIGLRVNEGVFGIDLAVLNPEWGEPTLKAFMELTHAMKKFNDVILAPSPSEPLQNMIDELEKLTPPELDDFSQDMEDLEGMESTQIDWDSLQESSTAQ
jgi:hypothetical protein